MSTNLNSELLKFHHIGCAVKNIDEALTDFRPFFAKITGPTLIDSQKVRVCFLEMAPGSYIEFVEPAAADSAVSVLLKRGISFYHVGFLTGAFDRALAVLNEQNHRLLHEFSSEAFEGRRCAFLMSETMQLIEVIESAFEVVGPSSHSDREAAIWG